MAYDDEVILAGQDQKIYVKLETTEGTINEPVVTDAILVTAHPSFVQNPEYIPDTQKQDTRSPLKEIKGRYPHGTFTFETFLKPTTAGTAPDVDPALEGLFCAAKVSNTATTVGSATVPTTTAFEVAATANVSTGTAILVTLPSGNKEVTWLTAKSAGGATITVSPALSTAPATGAAVGASVTYKTGNTKKTYTIFFKSDDMVFQYAGCGFERISLPTNGTEPMKGTFSGGFKKVIFTGYDALDASITTATATTIQPRNPQKFCVGSIFTINTEGFICTAIPAAASATIQATRGYDPGTATTVAAKHETASVTIVPWIPSTATITGSCVIGGLGTVKKDGSSYALLEANLDFYNGMKWKDEEKSNTSGKAYTGGVLLSAFRTCDITAKAYFKRKDAKLFGQWDEQDVFEVMVPAGNASGKVVAFRAPTTYIQQPTLSGDEEQIVDVNIKAYATSTFDNEVSLAFL